MLRIINIVPIIMALRGVSSSAPRIFVAMERKRSAFQYNIVNWRPFISTKTCWCATLPHFYYCRSRRSQMLEGPFTRKIHSTKQHWRSKSDHTISLASRLVESSSGAGGQQYSTSGKIFKPDSSNDLESNNILQILQNHHEGDWAGHVATFHPQSGELIPISEHYVPEALVEWGQIPPCLEVLTSERYCDGRSAESDENSSILAEAGIEPIVMDRFTTTVLPDVGCGLENLEARIHHDQVLLTRATSRENDESRFFSTEQNGGEGLMKVDHSVVQINNDGTMIRYSKEEISSGTSHNKFVIACEATFLDEAGVRRVTSNEDSIEWSQQNINNTYRTRIAMNLVPVLSEVDKDLVKKSTSQWTILSPISIVRERKTSKKSTNGSASQGGGLDAQTMANLIGIDNVNQPFVYKYPAAKRHDAQNDSSLQEGVGTTTFPGGVSLRWDKDDMLWSLCMNFDSQLNEEVRERIKRITLAFPLQTNEFFAISCIDLHSSS